VVEKGEESRLYAENQTKGSSDRASVQARVATSATLDRGGGAASSCRSVCVCTLRVGVELHGERGAPSA
jgi:hypothetical protein